MIRGLRAEDAALINGLVAGEQRLLLRLGALLQKHRALSELALQEALQSEGWRALLGDRQLADVAADPTAWEALCARHGVASDELVWQAAEDDWYVLVLADEIGNPLLLAASNDALDLDDGNSVDAANSFDALLASLPERLRPPFEALASASSDEERAAALEQVRYAGPDLATIARVLPMILADDAAKVRDRAVSLLAHVGAKPQVVSLIRALQDEDIRHIRLLAPQIQDSDAAQAELLLITVLGVLERGRAEAAVIDVLEALLTHLSRWSQLERLWELLLPQGAYLDITRLARALQAAGAAEVLATVLRAQLGASASVDARILVLLAAPGTPPDIELARRAYDLLLRPDENLRQRLPLAGALLRLTEGNDLARDLAQHGPALFALDEHAVPWLLAQLAQAQRIDPTDGDALLQTLIDTLAGGTSSLLVSVLEHDLPARLPATAATRAQLVEPLLTLRQRWREARSQDLVVRNIVACGLAAVEPLWRVVEAHPQDEQRAIAGELVATILLAHEQIDAAVVDRLVQAADGLPLRTRGRMVVAASRVASQLEGAAPTQQVLACLPDLGLAATEAWGHIGTHPGIPPMDLAAAVERLLGLIEQDQPEGDARLVVDAQTNETTYVLDAALGTHTEQIGPALSALSRIGSAESCPPGLRQRLCQRLQEQWSVISNWQTVWGPGNVILLAEAMARLGQSPALPSEVRLRLAQALAVRGQEPGIGVLTCLILAHDDSALAPLAVGLTTRVLAQLGAEHYHDDELHQVVDLLVALFFLPHVHCPAAAAERQRLRLAQQITSLRRLLPDRLRQRLRAAQPFPEAEVASTLAWLN